MIQVLSNWMLVFVTAITIAWQPSTACAEGTAQPGPHAANFRLLNNGSGISEYTGSLNWNQTLVTVPGRGGLDFPVNLTYSSGIGCEQEASWVGLGFGVNLGSIERSIVYLPDEMILYHYRGFNHIHQHDGWLVNDNYIDMHDSSFTDGPDMWTVALNDFGANMLIVTDSNNMFWDGTVPYGPEGKRDRAVDESASANWMSRQQRGFGLVMRVGGANYVPDSLWLNNNERQRHCYVSPPMGDTIESRIYNFSGRIALAFNDSTNGYGNNSGQCSVYVYKLPKGSTEWEVNGPYSIAASSAAWDSSNGVSVSTGDRFAVLVKSKKFAFEKWDPMRVDYEMEFTDWGGYYLNPEELTDPYWMWHQGYTSRLKSFTLTGRNGITYEFGQSDYIKATSQLHNIIVRNSEDSMSIAFDFSYKLTEILSSDYADADGNGIPSDADMGSWVRIVYDNIPVEVDYRNKPLRAFDASFQRWTGTYPTLSLISQRHFVHYPTFIETPTHELKFYLSSRDDNLGSYGPTSPDSLKRLDSLVLFVKMPVGGLKRQGKTVLTYADNVQPVSYADWVDGDVLGWHQYNHEGYDTLSGGNTYGGKLTLLSVTEYEKDGASLPPLSIAYATNPTYSEQLAGGLGPNPNVDFYQLSTSYYSGGYDENWGYYRTDDRDKPGDDQRAWSVDEITYPNGARETLEWESNRYSWWLAMASYGPNLHTVEYRDNEVPDSKDSLGVERGGIRLRTRRLDGGFGRDSSIICSYGEGIATKPQVPLLKAFETGFVGNSQGVAYRHLTARNTGDGSLSATTTRFTNGSAVPLQGHYNDGATPRPAVDSMRESFPDYVVDSVSQYFLEGTKRGLPYETFVISAAGDTLTKTETSYAFGVRHSAITPSSTVQHNVRGTARSIWVKPTQVRTKQYDENGTNPVLFMTTYDYDSLNGQITSQLDSLGNGDTRKQVTEYLHAQDTALDDALSRRNLLNLVYRTEIIEEDGKPTTFSRTTFDYKDFGNERIYPWHRYDYRKISPAVVETTTYIAYDGYGNLRQEKSPSGRKTTYLYGYRGSQMVLMAPNADTGEVSYTGFEDGLESDGWTLPQGSAQSRTDKPTIVLSTLSYSGTYSASLWKQCLSTCITHAKGLTKDVPSTNLVHGKSYVFSGWVRDFWDSAGVGMSWTGGDTAIGVTTNDQWERLEIVLEYDSAMGDIELYTHFLPGVGGGLFDDLRFHPFGCPMETYAYDRGTGQLEAAFDANNIAAERYHYDGFGRLSSVLDPDSNITARYEYYYSRSDSTYFDPVNPNYIKEIRFRSATDSSVTVTYYDGLGREVQTQTAVDSNTRIVSGKVYNYAGQLEAATKPIEYDSALGTMAYLPDLVPSGWTPGTAMTSGMVHAYYDSDGPGADCNGYPYTQWEYSEDPLRRIEEIGFPDVTWKVGSNRTVVTHYWTDTTGDVPGWRAGTLTKTQISAPNSTRYKYHDRLGRLVQVQLDSMGLDSAMHFNTKFLNDILGNLTASIRGKTAANSGTLDTDTTTYTYNALSQLRSKTSPDAGTTHFLHDGDGHLRLLKDAVQAGINRFIYYKYDGVGRTTEEGWVSDPAGTLFTQTNADNPNFPTSSNTVTFSYAYDSVGVDYGVGRLSSWVSGDGRYYRRLTYDQLGRVNVDSVKLDNIRAGTGYEYDWQGNLRVQEDLTAPPNRSDNRLVYGYDPSVPNRLSSVGAYNTSGILDAARLDRITYWPTGTIRSEYHQKNHSIVDTTVCQQVDYFYNPRDWLVAINDTGTVSSSTMGNGDHFALTLSYNKSYNGNIDSIGNKHSGSEAYGEIFTYDKLDRLERWHHKEAVDTTGDWIYSYNGAGNFLTWKKHDSQNQYWNTYYPGTNRLKKIGTGAIDTLTDYSWDGNGNLSREPGRHFYSEYRNITNQIRIPHPNWVNYLDLSYDADLRRVKKVYKKGRSCDCGPGELSVAGDSETPAPDAASTDDSAGVSLLPTGTPLLALDSTEGADRVTTDAAPGGDCVCYDETTQLYWYSYDGRLLRVYENNLPKRDFIYAGDRRIGVWEYTALDAANLHYYLTDHLGSTRALVDSTGAVKAAYDYYPYGTLRASTVSTGTKMRYTGKEHDDEEIEQDYYGARYLNGVTRRFNSVDPKEDKYPGWSPYVYTLANPIRLVDPNGEWVETAWDAASLALSINDFRNEPSVVNGIYVLADVAAVALPFVPAIAGVRHIGKVDDVVDLAKGVEKVADAADAAKAADKASDAAKSAAKAADAAKGEPPQLARGKRAHAQEPVRPGEVAEVRTPSGKRMDRYDPTSGQIREIKPDNPRQINKGRQQVEAYRKEMEQSTGRKHTGEVTTYDPDKYDPDKLDN